MSPPPSTRLARSLALLAAFSLSSCQYLKDRGADFLDQYYAAVGAGSVVGVRFENLGLIDTGLMMGIKPYASSLGWKYGSARYFDQLDPRFDADQAEIIKTTTVVGLDYGQGSYFSAKNSAAIVPALLSWVDATPIDYEWRVPEEGADFKDRTWIWNPQAFSVNHYAQIHAFDIETEVGLIVYLGFGYSPGELVDFLLGIVTIDIAGDDGRF